MKKYTGYITATLTIMILLLATDAFARRGMRGPGSGGWGMGTNYGRMYNPKTVEIIKGDVVSVDKITPNRGMHYGIHITVKTAKETISVHLGPGWFIENQDIRVKVNDRVKVKGSRITFQGEPAIIAAEITKGDAVLKLRDENGIPVWVGWRRR